MHLIEQKSCSLLSQIEKQKKKKKKQMQEMESAKQGLCYFLLEKISEENVFQKS